MYIHIYTYIYININIYIYIIVTCVRCSKPVGNLGSSLTCFVSLVLRPFLTRVENIDTDDGLCFNMNTDIFVYECIYMYLNVYTCMCERIYVKRGPGYMSAEVIGT